MAGEIRQLLRSTLVLIAHPDDESIGCGILLQRMADACVVLCTDGAPAMGLPWHSRAIHPRARVAAKRLAEFRAASSIAGVRRLMIVPGIEDQMLYQFLDSAAEQIAQHIVEHRPDAILSHAFEAGHPDHDACAFLAQWAGCKFSVPVWEMPLYYRRTPSSSLTYQQFLCSFGNEIALCVAPEELRKKEWMLSQYRSQAAVISEFDKTREVFRPQPAYNFRVNPNPALSMFAVCENVPIASALGSFRSFGARRERVL